MGGRDRHSHPGAVLNAYNDLRPDLTRLPISAHDSAATSRASTLAALCECLRLYAQAGAQAIGLHRRLVYANLRLDWFHEFQAYWCGVLGGRPITPLDFGYLLGTYRSRAQIIALDDDSPEAMLKAWSDPSLIYLLFTSHYRLALNPLRVWPFIRWIPRGSRVLEYGCGIAPMLTGLARYYRRLDLRLYGTDLPHVLFHFARWKLGRYPFVLMKPLGEPFFERFDVGLCTEVLEHVPSPLQTLRNLHEMLAVGGVLIYDFEETDGRGLDSPTAQAERPAVRDFMASRFTVVGRVGGVVVARKD